MNGTVRMAKCTSQFGAHTVWRSLDQGDSMCVCVSVSVYSIFHWALKGNCPDCSATAVASASMVTR